MLQPPASVPPSQRHAPTASPSPAGADSVTGVVHPINYQGLSAMSTSPLLGNYRSALADPNWCAAMANEYQALSTTTLGASYLDPRRQHYGRQADIKAQDSLQWLSCPSQGSMGASRLQSAARRLLRRDFQSSCQASHHPCCTQHCTLTKMANSSTRREECLPACQF